MLSAMERVVGAWALVTVVVASLGGAACGDDDCCVTDAAVPDAFVDPYTEVVRFPITVNRDIDILFVIDDSPWVLDKQTNLKNNFPNFINVLNTIEGGLPNVHLGVVSSDLGTKGADDATAGPGIGSGPGSCSGNGKAGNLQTNGSTLVSGNFISDTKNTDGTRSTNYSGALSDAFSAIASLGASGCGFEQHLEAAKRAVNNNPSNSGFVRPNAYLALIFIQDEDDCSFAHSTILGSDTNTLGPLQSFRCNRFGHVCETNGSNPTEMNLTGNKGVCSSAPSSQYLTSLDGYVSFFKGLKAAPANVVVAAIAGPTTPYEVELRTPPGGGTAIPAVAHSCSYVGGTGQPEVADPSTRLVEFLNQFPNRNTFSTICQQDLSGSLTQIAQLLRLVVGSPGVNANVSPTADCRVTETSGGVATMVPACGAARPCYRFETDPANCPSAPNQRLVIDRDQAPPPDAVVSMRCLL